MTKMRLGSLEYDLAVEKRQRKIRGNIQSVKMTESECAAEVEAVTEGIFAPIEHITREEAEKRFPRAEPLKRKPGRPLGSRNKPKESK